MVEPVMRNAPPISDEPEEILTDWRIFRLPNGDQHFCGFRENGATIRTSSRIILFHAETNTGMTASGRIYRLQGPQGRIEHLRVAVGLWCIGNGIEPRGVQFL